MGLVDGGGGVLVGWGLCKRVTEGWIEVGDCSRLVTRPWPCF